MDYWVMYLDVLLGSEYTFVLQNNCSYKFQEIHRGIVFSKSSEQPISVNKKILLDWKTLSGET